MKRKKIIVLMGGPSSEHEVSLASGKNVIEALDPKKYTAYPVIVSKKGRWLLPAVFNSKVIASFAGRRTKQSREIATPRHRSGLAMTQFSERPDIAFIAMHGKYGEDGTIQAILEALRIPYTGSGVLASALGMDKPRASAVFKAAGFNVPEFAVFTRQQMNVELFPERSRRDTINKPKSYPSTSSGNNFSAKLKKFTNISFPLVVKPANHGSSVGISIVKNAGELKSGIREALRYSDRAIVQNFIRGREITCGVLENPPTSLYQRGNKSSLSPLFQRGVGGDLIALPPTEIRPKKGAFYDYRSKYDDGGSEHVIPPVGLPQKTIKMIQDAACRAHQVIGCSGMSRSDFILGDDGKLYILEINTIPGMTSTSLLPEAANKTGISFSKLLNMLIENALKRPH